MIRLKILSILTPFIKWWGGLHFPFTRKKVTGVHYYDCYRHLQNGVIFLSYTRGEFSNLFLSGEFTHAAIYTPDSSRVVDEFVTEAIGKGVIKKDLISFMTSKDRVVILKPKFAGKKIMNQAALYASQQIGKPYDYSFQKGNESFYCSELVWWSYNQVYAKNDKPCPFTPRLRFGFMTVTPDDIWKAKDKFDVIWDSKKVSI